MLFWVLGYDIHTPLYGITPITARVIRHEGDYNFIKPLRSVKEQFICSAGIFH